MLLSSATVPLLERGKGTCLHLRKTTLQKNSYAANQSLQRLLSAHYLKYSGIFSRRLLTSLKQRMVSQTLYVIFWAEASKQNNKILLTADRFHITPSKFNFSNNLLLQLAKPKQWTTTLVSCHHLHLKICVLSCLSCLIVCSQLVCSFFFSANGVANAHAS